MSSVDLSNLNKLTVKDLRKELEDRGLDSNGLKQALVERLEAFLSSSTIVSAPPASPKPADTAKAPVSPVEASAVPAETQAATAGASTYTRIEYKPTGNPAAAELTELQKKQARAKKFGITLSETEQKALRNERFGTAKSGSLPAPAKAASGSLPAKASAKPAAGNKSSILSTETKMDEATKKEELEKQKARAKRFNLPVTSNTEEQAKKKARAASGTTANGAAKLAPAAGTGKGKAVVSAEEEAKRKARSLRFATAPPPASGEAVGTTAEQVKKLEDRKIRFGAGKVGETGPAAISSAGPSAQA